MNNERFQLPVCRIYPNSIVLYHVFDTPLVRSDAQRRTEENLTRGVYNGYMSPKTRSKVKKYLSTWLASVQKIRKSNLLQSLDKQPYITFVTLTLPSAQLHEDNEIKRKCLTPYIETLKRKYNVWNYFWRAEAQKNGNIHFHILIDSYIHHTAIRNEWNQCINKLGYVDKFKEKHGHDNPNSTDIHSLKKIGNVEAYVIKYCCKSDGYRQIDGRIHGCSDDLKKLTPYECLVDEETEKVVEMALKDVSSKVIREDNYTIIMCHTPSFLYKYSRRKYDQLNINYITTAQELYNIKPREPDIYETVTRIKSEVKQLVLEL